MRWKSRTSRAFTLVEIMVTVAVIGLLATLVLGSLARARRTVQMQLCIDNQRAIYDAVMQYEIDTAQSLMSIRYRPDLVRDTLLAGGYIKDQSGFQCPASSSKTYDSYSLYYSAAGNFTNTYCRVATSQHVLQ